MKIIVELMFCEMEHLNLNSLGRGFAWCLVFLKIVCESFYEFYVYVFVSINNTV